MLVVKAKAASSAINGVGLFAEEFIPRGTVVWKFDPRFDLVFDPAEIAGMSEVQRNFIEHFTYLSKTIGKYVLSIDDSRFINHSADANLSDGPGPSGDAETHDIASRDIQIGKEILANYRSFDANDDKNQEPYLDQG